MTIGPSSARHRPRRQGPDDGVVTVFVADEQDDRSGGEHREVDGPRWSQLAEQVLGAEGIRGEAELSVLFVSESHIADLNQRFMGHEGPTDVLSFPIDGALAAANATDYGEEMTEVVISGTGPLGRMAFDPDDQPLLLGDIVICPDIAAAQAASHAGTYDDEVALLVVHGILHILGRDHAEADERESMQARERELLEQFYGPLARDPWS